jgi:TolB-like protein
MNYRKLSVSCALVLAACAAVRPYQFTNYTRSREAMDAIGRNSVAVLYFSGPEGERLSREFSLQLGRLGRFNVVERRRVDDLFDEQDLDLGRVEENTAAHLGRMLGAQAVVTGEVRDFRQGRVSANLRLVTVETGEIAWQGSDVLQGGDERVQALVTDSKDKDRLRRDPDYLATWLAKLMAESIK